MCCVCGTQKKGRNKMCCMLGILVIILAVIVVIVMTGKKSK